MKTFFSTKQFNYDPATRTFMADMSTLDEGGKKQVFGHVYSDACDCGMYLVSHRTGEKVPFVLDESWNVHGGGDHHTWRLNIEPEYAHDHPHCAGLKILIFNT